MTRQPTNTILFDWDGTLCDSGAASRRAFRKSLAEFGIDFTDELYKAVYTPEWYRMYEAFGLPQEHWLQADQHWLQHYRGEEPELLAGAREMLDHMRSRQIRLGVVTNGTRRRIEQELTRLGVGSTFEALVCFEDVTEKKPHPEGIERALTLVGCDRQGCWYVGDTPEDVQAGKRAGLFTVAVRSDYVAADRLEACGPDRILANISELPSIVG